MGPRAIGMRANGRVEKGLFEMKDIGEIWQSTLGVRLIGIGLVDL